MSKGKNQKKNNNKPSNIPVKNQQLKPQKQTILKTNQISLTRNGQNPITKTTNKGAPKMNQIPKSKGNTLRISENIKIPKKDVDISQSDEDEDEDDSDIDDVDLGDSDDLELGDSDDLELGDSDDLELGDSDDLEVGDSDDDDNSVEDVDLESIEFEDTENSDVVEIPIQKVSKKPSGKKEVQKPTEKKEVQKPTEKKEVQKPTEKKEVQKPTEKKEVQKPTEKKEVQKPTEKKEVQKPTEKKEVQKQAQPVIQSGDDVTLLKEINRRKNLLNDCVVFLSNVQTLEIRELLVELLKANNLPLVNLNIPLKNKSRNTRVRGYGFIRLFNAEDAKKAIEVVNNMDNEKSKLRASKFVCKKVYDDSKNVKLCTLLVHSFHNEDFSDKLKNQFKKAIKVDKNLPNQYTVEFAEPNSASEVFKKEHIKLDGKPLLINYLYKEAKGSSLPKTSKQDVKHVEVVKAGIKRSNLESDSDEELIVKKKKVNGNEKIETPVKAVTTSTILSPQTNKKEKKELEKSPSSKLINKSPEKKQFNKSPGNKQFNKSSGNKQINKSPGNKQFNKSPRNKSMNQSPGGKINFNKSPGDKKTFKKSSPGNRK